MEGPSGSTSTSWNRNNPAIRRILADIRELSLDPSDQYAAQPMEDNMFDWHFAIRGPVDTDFEGGVYHGRIILPSEYPFKPPSIMFLTPNGRWEINTKVCLSISAYHPEEWQPAWGIRTILEAIVSFMTAPGEGSVGALEFTPEERKRLAKESLNYKHVNMPALPELSSTPRPPVSSKYKDEIAKMHMVALEPKVSDAKDQDGASAKPDPNPSTGLHQKSQDTSSSLQQGDSNNILSSNNEKQESLQVDEEPQQQQLDVSQPVRAPSPAQQERETETSTRQHESESQQNSALSSSSQSQRTSSQEQPQTDVLFYVAAALASAIFFILYRKALKSFRDEL